MFLWIIFRASKSSSPGNAQVTIMRPGGQGQQPVAAQEVRAELARHLLALLLTPPSSFPMEYSYAGDAEALDGKDDVVDAKGPAGFAAAVKSTVPDVPSGELLVLTVSQPL